MAVLIDSAKPGLRYNHTVPTSGYRPVPRLGFTGEKWRPSLKQPGPMPPKPANRTLSFSLPPSFTLGDTGSIGRHHVPLNGREELFRPDTGRIGETRALLRGGREKWEASEQEQLPDCRVDPSTRRLLGIYTLGLIAGLQTAYENLHGDEWHEGRKIMMKKSLFTFGSPVLPLLVAGCGRRPGGGGYMQGWDHMMGPGAYGGMFMRIKAGG